MAKVDLLDLPSGLNASETKRSLQKNGAEVRVAPFSRRFSAWFPMKAVFNRSRRLEKASSSPTGALQRRFYFVDTSLTTPWIGWAPKCPVAGPT
jgi:hypothetical protein